MTELDPHKQQAMIKALEKRFGKSTMPYAFKPEPNFPGEQWRCTDVESGSYIIARTPAWRICVMRAHDGQALKK